ncbi:MAG: DoxX family protein [Acidobacteria bacterium]|nr:DoxX family protein [Acidobacteriota bacterium]
MTKFPFLSLANWLVVLRIALSLMMAAHGVIRIYAGTVGGFGEFLSNKGFPVGELIAWTITFFEIIGGSFLVFDKFKKWICVGFILQLFMGIILVHASRGWFVVGYTTGGMEYSVLLILCFLLVSSTEGKKIK